ncbi:FAD-binding oxidoreductase [Modestobacter marinus]|uniref:FAD-binding oxidoreductase n=1 Tax=Modestobacter marinus TaxID=477641 RepID=UPI0027E13425|nr:FAD-binding oxidoreductase [Modestobacter marinus]
MTSLLDTAVDETTAVDAPFDVLDAVLTGSVHTPDDPGYGPLVSPWNLAVPVQPAAVVDARTAQDVATAVRFAGAFGLRVGVQATGHGAVPGITGDLLISTKGLDELTVHPEGWARVGAGVKWLRVIEAAAPLGLAPLNGSSSDVGVVGYTTGGGVGPMTRTHGLAADRVRAFDVVTGDGVLRRVTPTEHPDLFWALRGGKGTTGIVTAVEFDLLRMSTFYGGAIYFDGADTARVVEAWRHWSATLPEEGTTSFVIFQLPPLEFVPPPLAGRMTLGVRFLWTGDPAEGARLLDQLRAVAPVVLDDAALKPYTAVDSVHADPVDPMPVIDPAILLRDFPAEAAELLLAVAGPGSGSPQVLVEVRQLGGAYAREAEHPNAFDHRAARYSVLVVGMAPDPAAPGHAEAVFSALADWDTGTVWPNFGPVHDARSARRAYGEATRRRLAEIVAAYDPDGVLTLGRWTRETD